MKVLTVIFGVGAIVSFLAGIVVLFTQPFSAQSNENCVLAFFVFGVIYTLIFRLFAWISK